MTETIQTFNTAVNVTEALLWQYNGALRLQELLEEKQAWYDVNQTQFWDDWYRDVFDLNTANEFGLSVWAIILGQPIVFNNVADPTQVAWGFEDTHKNFTRGNFVRSSGFTYILAPESARILLKLRYFQLVSSGTVPETNRMLKYVFGDLGTAYLVDNQNMTQEYIFNFPLTQDLNFLFKNFDILPRPAGVRSSYSVII